MSSHLIKLFEDQAIVKKIKTRLPYLFQVAEIESSRAGKIGMEVGSLRERIVVALLIHVFGEKNVETEIPITEPEVDVRVYDRNISVKSITGKYFSGVKLVWTVDAQKAKEFRETYHPNCDMILIQLNWGGQGGFFHIPLEAQKKVITNIGRERYIKLPKAGTNPRGVEITKECLSTLIKDQMTNIIEIWWQKQKITYDPYKRWMDSWEEDSYEVK